MYVHIYSSIFQGRKNKLYCSSQMITSKTQATTCGFISLNDAKNNALGHRTSWVTSQLCYFLAEALQVLDHSLLRKKGRYHTSLSTNHVHPLSVSKSSLKGLCSNTNPKLVTSTSAMGLVIQLGIVPAASCKSPANILYTKAWATGSQITSSGHSMAQLPTAVRI